MTYPFVAAPDHWPRTRPIRAIVVHHAEGGGTVSWLTRNDGNSAHYVVEYTGRVVQMVREDRAAGSIDPTKVRTTDDAPFEVFGETVTYGLTANKASLGDAWRDPNAAVIAIEVEGFARVGPNVAQRGALRALVKDIRSRHGNLPTLGHRDFQSYKACPGKLIPWVDYGGHGPAQEEDMPGLTITDLESAPGTVTVKNIAGVQAVQVDDPTQRFGMPPGTSKPTVAKGRLVGDPLGKDTATEDRHTVRLIGQELAVLLDSQVTFAPEADTVVSLAVNGTTKYEVRV